MLVEHLPLTFGNFNKSGFASIHLSVTTVIFYT